MKYVIGKPYRGKDYQPRPSDNLQGIAEEQARREQDEAFRRHLAKAYERGEFPGGRP
jgi:hypothetical protein